jgi:hypothetical protein
MRGGGVDRLQLASWVTTKPSVTPGLIPGDGAAGGRAPGWRGTYYCARESRWVAGVADDSERRAGCNGATLRLGPDQVIQRGSAPGGGQDSRWNTARYDD